MSEATQDTTSRDITPRKLIVIGASADGVFALRQIIEALPQELPAAVLIVSHIGKETRLPRVLARVAMMPVMHPYDGELLRPGRVYVAPPGHHMRVGLGTILVSPDSQLRHRPSVDELFISAAHAYGPDVIGVVLTGYLYDGAAGLRAIKEAGGIAVIQDPRDAAVPDMPRAAANATAVDYCCRINDIGPLLARLASDDAGDASHQRR